MQTQRFPRRTIAHPIFLLCFLTALPLPGGDPAATIGGVALYTQEEKEIPVGVRDAMREELDEILSPIGVQFEWRALGAGGDRRSWRMLAVIRFKGTCDSDNLPNYPPYVWRLGQTHAVDGHIIPYVDIFCEPIRALLAPGLGSLDEKERVATFGAALGRVLAHELYHLFVRSQSHGLSGLGKAQCTPDELLGEEHRFRGSEMTRLRKALLPALINHSDSETPPEGLVAFAQHGCLGCHGPQGGGTRWGPKIHPEAVPDDVAQLNAKLRSNGSEMTRRARALKVWSPVPMVDAGRILQFLKTDTLDKARRRR